MAYQTISPNELASGKPMTTTTGAKIRGNLDDHETRLQSLEGGGNTIYPPLILRVNGPLTGRGGLKGLVKTTTSFQITITGVRLIIDTAGSSGTTKIDIQYKRGAADWASIFLGEDKPSVAYSAGNDAVSNNGILDTTKVNLLAGDLIRLNCDSAQVGGYSFTIRIDYIKT